MSSGLWASYWIPWTDRKGRLDPLRATVFGLLWLPAAWLLCRAELGMLGPRALNTAIHSTGYWAVSFLVASLIVRPAKSMLGLPQLIVVRRMIGNAALAYALLHLTLYCADQNWRMGTVVSEIVHRIYLTIGFVALLGLLTLGLTSTDAAVWWLGRRWKQLHRLTYGIGVLALIHFTLQTKADVSLPLLYAGVFVWLMLWRMLPTGPDRRAPALLGLTAVAALLTGALEWVWYRFGTHIDPAKVLRSETDVAFGLHPIGQVLALGALAVGAIGLYRLSLGRAGRHPAFWILLFAGGAAVNEAVVWVFGIDRYLDPGDLSWLWADLAWAALMGVLGFLRWAGRESKWRRLADGLGVACVLFQVMLSSDGLRGAGIVFALAIAGVWAIMAWKTWRTTKLAAVSLVPLALLLAYGVSGLM